VPNETQPDTNSIEHGGVVLYAVQGDDGVGTVALKHQGGGVFELTKMAVTKARQGQGVGRQSLSASVARFEKMTGSKLYLQSNSRMGPAPALYESAGFRHESPPEPSDYDRADVYMIYRPAMAQHSN